MKPSKSDRTKSRILDASRTLFAQFGYEATTIRGIAEKAGIDPSMVIRYFGSKDALFALTVDFEMGNVAAPLSGGSHTGSARRQALPKALGRRGGKSGTANSAADGVLLHVGCGKASHDVRVADTSPDRTSGRTAG